MAKGYCGAWELFSAFCKSYDLVPLPPSEEVIFAFVAWLEVQGKGRRAAHHVAAISYVLRKKGLMDWTKATWIRIALQGVARLEVEEKMEVRGPFPLVALQRWVAMKRERPTVREWRDPALVALGM
jgi:hypothetical protein